MRNKKVVVTIIITILIILLVVYAFIFLNRNTIRNLNGKLSALEKNELINIEVNIKEETEEAYKGVIIFTSKDENNLIKSIEYPETKGSETKVITIEKAKQKVAIDYEFEKEDIDKVFKIATEDGTIINRRTCYTIKYNPNSGINSPKDEKIFIGPTKTVLTTQQPIREGYVFWGWSEDKTATEPEYLKGNDYSNSSNSEEIILYAVWEDQNRGIVRYISDEKVNKSGIYSTSVFGIKYNFEVTYLDANNISEYGGFYNASTNTYTINDLEIGTAEGITIDEKQTQAMAVLKCDGNLIINGTLSTSTYSETSPSGVKGEVTKIKGLFVYCSGELTNNGIISQTARGTHETEGENVYLWSKDSCYDGYFVPASGASGVAMSTVRNGIIKGYTGKDGEGRETRWRWSRSF